MARINENSTLPSQFRKWNIEKRRTELGKILKESGLAESDIRLGLGESSDLVSLADLMIESAVGYLAIPLGICRGLLLDGLTVDVPLATEEPSVVAAASLGAAQISRAGGFRTSAGSALVTGQVFLENFRKGAAEAVGAAEEEIRAAVAPVLASMEQRGGGFRGIDVALLEEPELLRVQIHLDVCDAMGANAVNTAVEHLRPTLEKLSGGTSLMAILTNEAEQRLSRAEFSIAFPYLSRDGTAGAEMARRVCLAGELAQSDPSRAITHNKGVMNGVTALMLATGNDTRAVEAAAHYHATTSGSYRGLTRYRIEGENLVGEIELPVPAGTVGGATRVHPSARLAMALLGDPGARELARIAAAVGLAQNYAALSALVAEGIQQGHMALHERRTGHAE